MIKLYSLILFKKCDEIIVGKVLMNIALAIRPDYLTRTGGDTYQILKTKEYIEKYNDINVCIINDPEDLNANIDILHVFNLQTIDFTYRIIEKAKLMDINVVLSPTIWELGTAIYMHKVLKLTRSMCIARLFKQASKLFEWRYLQSKIKEKKKILRFCNMILPNSFEEGVMLRKQYGIEFEEMIVPNCVDMNLTEENTEIEMEKGFVLQVGRIEATKNQLGLIEAMMKHKDIPLVFIGKQHKDMQFYVDKVKKLGAIRGNTVFIDELPQEKLTNYYKAAKVHVLPSFRESPGLVSLEALFYGCNIVVSNEMYCPIKYYRFDEFGYTCDPLSPVSIEKAVLKAYKDDPVKVSDDYFDFYSYKNAAKITRQAYLKVLGLNG